MAVQTVPPKTNGTPQNLEALIAASLQAVEEAKRQEEAEREAQRRRQVAAALDALHQWLGDLAFLVEQGEVQEKWVGDHLSRLSITLRFPPEQRLAPIRLTWEPNYNPIQARVFQGQYSVAVDRPEFLLAVARENWEAWQQYQRQQAELERLEAIQKWRERLSDAAHFDVRFHDREDLETARQNLAQVWEQVPEDFKPELEATYRRALERLREAEDALARHEAHEAQKRAYIQTLARWYREQVLPIREALRKIQKEAESRELTVYRVEYGVVAEDEDDERFVDTRAFYTWHPTPDAQGYFTTVSGRRVRPEHVVLVEEIRTTVGGCPWEVQDALPRLDWSGGWGALRESVRIHFHPEEAHRVEELRRQYPDLEPPEPPIDLSFYEKREVFKAAYREATGQEPVPDDLD